MKEEKAKYLLVPSNTVIQSLYVKEKESGFNDNWVEAYWKENIVSSEVFNRFNVPEEYQRIIIRINNYLFNKSLNEFITNINFDIWKIYRENNIKRIDAFISKEDSDLHHMMSNSFIYNRVSFDTKLDYYSYSEVLDFLKGMDNDRYLKAYLDSITNIMLNKYYNKDNNIFSTKEETYELVKRRIKK